MSLGIIKVIDSLSSITRVGVTTVTFGRKCHSMFNDVSDDRPYFGAFFQYGRHSQSNAAGSADTAEREVGRGGWRDRMKRRGWQDGWEKEKKGVGEGGRSGIKVR